MNQTTELRKAMKQQNYFIAKCKNKLLRKAAKSEAKSIAVKFNKVRK